MVKYEHSAITVRIDMPSIRILGSHGNRSEKFHTTCIQVSKHTVIDAGNIIYGLGNKAKDIDNIFISHSHLDHILDSAFLCDNFFSERQEPIRVYALKETIKTLKENMFNWKIWPDFTKLTLEHGDKKALEFIEIDYDKPISIDDVILTPIKSNHTVDCCGYLIEKEGSGILFSGDTHVNDRLWEILNSSLHVKSLIIDVSFPSSMDKLARDSKHMTPKVLKEELTKLQRDDVEIYINHIKSNFQEVIEKEITDIGLKKENILTGYEEIDISIPRLIKKGVSYTQIEKVKMLNNIGIALSLKTNLASLLELILTEARNLTNADAGTLYILNDKTNELNFNIVQNNTLDIYMGGSKGKINWKPLPLYLSNGKPNLHMVAATCALTDKVINIPDVYEIDKYDFSGTKKFDKSTGYRSCSMLVIPLKNHEQKIIGVLQLINKMKRDEVVAFDSDDEEITLSLASQAAVSITNTNLINDLEKLLESFLKSIIYAIRKKSAYTANHIHKMVELSKMIARKINEDQTIYKDRNFSEDELKQINFAALMHDIGKLATPDYILDKATKLDGLYDRIEVIKTRAWAIEKEFEVALLKKEITNTQYNNAILEIETDLELLVASNEGAEFVPDEVIKKIDDISKKAFTCNGQDFYLITKEEAELLMVQKGTITDEERNIINEHAKISLDILNKLPFPQKYKNIPSIAGEHHEKINGKGYPQGLKGDEISFESRILAIADIFEALTAGDRPYKKANKLSVAMKILYFMAKDDDLDRELIKFFYESGLYLEFAKKLLSKDQIDEVDIDFSY
jgi:HD-GYP domain-containing protein (c-di-GMP phosphodiesterase class II)/ribonuclease BN (tRNA processing enzyme)